MASESDSGTNTHAKSKATERFIARATKIGEDPEFKTKLNQAREVWNQDYPNYRIKPHVPNIVEPSALEGEDLPLPPRLVEAIKPLRDGSWQQSLKDARDLAELDAKGQEWMARHEDALRAISSWNTRVWTLAREGWPPKLYPNWHGRFALNPARRFVAACLIWGPDKLCPEEWIDPIPHTALIQSIPFDPTYPLAIPDVFRWKTAFDALATLLNERSTEGRPLTPEESAALIEEARQHGEQMGSAVSGWANDHEPEGFRFVRLRRGMNATDWRTLEPAVVQSQIDTYGEDQWADEARRLHAEGRSQAQIAREVGVDRRTVRRWIEEQD